MGSPFEEDTEVLEFSAKKEYQQTIDVVRAEGVYTLRKGKENIAKALVIHYQPNEQVKSDIRVSGKNRDDLQTVIAALKALDLDIPLTFTNYRST